MKARQKQGAILLFAKLCIPVSGCPEDDCEEYSASFY